MDFLEKVNKKLFFGIFIPVGLIWCVFTAFFLPKWVPNILVSNGTMFVGLIALTYICYRISKNKE